MTLREEMARAMCIADGVDPDAKGYGMGHLMPKGEVYPLWRTQLRRLDAAFTVLEKTTPDEAP